MKIGDIVQARRFDGAEHWVYAIALSIQNNASDSPVRVQIQHPGNSENEKVLVLSREEIRTKSDLVAMVDKIKAIVAKAHHQHGLTHVQIRELGKLDGFWLHYLDLDEKNQGPRINLHKEIVKHYQRIMEQLS